MKKLILLLSLFASTHILAQSDTELANAFLKSVQEKNFDLLKPWLGPNVKIMQQKWQKIVNNAHRQGFDIKDVKIKEVLAGRQIPDLPVKSIIAVYKYDGKEWDDILLMITPGDKITLAEIPLTSHMFMLDEERRGNNIKDSKRKD